MIIHSYFTNGLYGWAKLFVESYVHHHGEQDSIFLTTRDLSEDQVKELNDVSSCVKVSNKKIDVDKIAERARLPRNEVLALKKHIERYAVTKDTYIWKQAISVEDRYRDSILEAMDAYPGEEYMTHFDIDVYFRQNLSELFDVIKANDISIKFRLNSQLNRKVLGGLIGFKLCDSTRDFMSRWIHHIDALPLYEKPLGYGQTSFYYAYLDMKDDLTWGDIPIKFISPKFLESDAVWAGNTKDGKEKNLKKCYRDFNNRSK